MNIPLDVKCPLLPNFLILKGVEKEVTFPIENLTIQQVDEYLELYKTEFIKHWRNKNKNK